MDKLTTPTPSSQGFLYCKCQGLYLQHPALFSICVTDGFHLVRILVTIIASTIIIIIIRLRINVKAIVANNLKTPSPPPYLVCCDNCPNE